MRSELDHSLFYPSLIIIALHAAHLLTRFRARDLKAIEHYPKCIHSPYLPSGETRRQKHLSVFFCTASWSIFAYIWLYLIIAIITPGRIQVWEAILTFCFFPLLVFNAYLLDTQVILKKFLAHRYK